MANLGYGLETTRHGHTALETKRNKAMTAYTKANLVDLEKCPRCSFYRVDGECLCVILEEPLVPTQTRVEPSASVPRMVTPSHYLIDSSTQTLVSYDLRLGEHGEWNCTCAGYGYRRECRHVVLLANYLGTTKPTQKPASPVVEERAGGNTVMHLGTALEALWGFEEAPVPKRRERTKEAW